MTNKFKTGQKVQRINGSFYATVAGQVYTVGLLWDDNNIRLEGLDGLYMTENFIAVDDVVVPQEPTPQELLAKVMATKAEYEAALTIRNDARRAVDAAEKETDSLYSKLEAARKRLKTII